MLNTLFGRLAALSLLVVSWCGASWGAGSQRVRVLSHTAGNGSIVSAVVLTARELPNGIVARDHVILVDTSASQVGDHRQQALAVLDSLLTSLPPEDRVRLFAVDVEVEPLDCGFNKPQSAAIREGLELLKSRVPLGATNLEGALRTALRSISDRPSDITYIGDGMSTADLIEIPELRSLVSELRQRSVPVHSFAVGPQQNLQLLGILALQTGGFIAFDSQLEPCAVQAQKTKSSKLRMDISRVAVGSAERAAQQGRMLATALHEPVFLPDELKLTETGVSLLPHEPLPIRRDRESIYVVVGSLPEHCRIVLSDSTSHSKLEWTCDSPASQPSAAFLPIMAHELENTAGLKNSLAGLELFQLAEVEFSDQVTRLAQNGRMALRHGDLQQAEKISNLVAQADPGNDVVRTLRDEMGKLRVIPVKQRLSRSESADAMDQSADPLSTVPSHSNASLLDRQQELIRVETTKLRSAVSNVIEAARRSDDSEAALATLKQVLGAVRSAIDIPGDDRQRMEKQLDTEILQQETLKEQMLQEHARRIQRMAQAEALKRLSEQATLDEERLENLIDRVRALMLEGRHGRDNAYQEAQEVADVAINMRPGEGTSAATRFDSEAALQLSRAYRLRARRADQFLEAAYQVELSHIPFPDEPPIRFPPADVWKALSARRKERAAVDLKRTTPNERRIKQALSETTEVSFTDNPLEEAINYLEDLHHIEIWIDKQALQDEGINLDTQITLEMKGITLRSALRLLLEPLALTYVIEDEVMKITTQTKADEIMSTRVYPVADLVIPIQPPMMGGMMGRGGMGGGMGGMGGGMMGGGMGGMGGGMGGMGGGMFSIPPETVTTPDLEITSGLMTEMLPSRWRHNAASHLWVVPTSVGTRR